MQMYRDYIKERLGHDLVELPGIGFATYAIQNGECYIIDTYVEKSLREGGYAKKLADQIVLIAKENGCAILKGSVCLTAANIELSVKGMLAYGFKIVSANDNFLIFKKAI